MTDSAPRQHHPQAPQTSAPRHGILDDAAFETLAVHAGGEPDLETGAVAPPIYSVSTYAQDAVASPRDGYIYGRGSNPTRRRLEQRLTALEAGAHACAFSSGMAAENAIFSALCSPGDEVLIPTDVYGGTYRLLDKVFTRWGLSYLPVPISDVNAIQSAVKPGTTRVIWCETPTNPLLQLSDIAQLSIIARQHGIVLVVDNTFASPYLQQPLKLGADVVVHSTTKYLGGHSDVIGGAVITNSDEIGAAIRFYQNAAGAIPSPFDSWLILRGSQTLAVRLDRQSDTAFALAKSFIGHPAIEQVYYPGLDFHPGNEIAKRQMKKFGGIISLTLAGGEDAALQVCNSVSLFTLAESLGGVESLICHPLRMTHASAARSSVAPPSNLIRLSIGVEAIDDLAADIFSALDNVKLPTQKGSLMSSIGRPLCSYDEWSRLREVIVGTAGELKAYSIDRTFAAFYFENIYGPITNESETPFRDRDRTLNVGFVHGIIEQLNEDIEGLVQAIKDYGANVIRPVGTMSDVEIKTPYWVSRSTSPLNIRDQTIILGDTIVETAPQIRGRLFENDALKPIFQQYFDRGAVWLSMPRPTLGADALDLSYLIDNGYHPLERLPADNSLSVQGLGFETLFDGAQCIRLGQDVLVNVANSNHQRGLTWLQRCLGNRFRFIKLYRLADSHVDSLVLPLRPGLLLVRSPIVLDFLPESMKHWDIIVAPTPREARFPTYPRPLANLASRYIDMNILSLDENTVIVNSLYPELIAKLEEQSFTVIPVRHRHRRLFGGGFHCFTLDCVRDGSLESYL